jgi:hypothetical protein
VTQSIQPLKSQEYTMILNNLQESADFVLGLFSTVQNCATVGEVLFYVKICIDLYSKVSSRSHVHQLIRNERSTG